MFETTKIRTLLHRLSKDIKKTIICAQKSVHFSWNNKMNDSEKYNVHAFYLKLKILIIVNNYFVNTLSVYVLIEHHHPFPYIIIVSIRWGQSCI